MTGRAGFFAAIPERRGRRFRYRIGAVVAVKAERFGNELVAQDRESGYDEDRRPNQSAYLWWKHLNPAHRTDIVLPIRVGLYGSPTRGIQACKRSAKTRVFTVS